MPNTSASLTGVHRAKQPKKRVRMTRDALEEIRLNVPASAMMTTHRENERSARAR